MSERRLFTTSNTHNGRSAAMRWAAERSSGYPHSVLYICPPEVHEETLEDQWEQQHGPRLALQTTRFDSVVDRLYEGDTYEGPSTYASQAERQWVIEVTLKRITDESNPLYREGKPTVGLVQQAENVLSLLEFAGLDSKKAVREELMQIGVEHLADPLADFTAKVEAVRNNAFTQRKTFRAERYLHAIQQGKELAASEFSEIDVVVVGAFQTLSPLERDLIGLFSSVFDTGIVSTRVTAGQELSGVDNAISRITSWYNELGFAASPTQETAQKQANSARETIAASLYQYADSEVKNPESLADDVKIETHSTVRHEVAAITRHVRSLIAKNIEPENICVAPFDSETYTKRIAQQLQSADVPVNYDASCEFFSTMTGDLIDAVIDLGTEPERQDPLVRLVSNPLVQIGTDSCTETIFRKANLVESTRINILQSQLEQPTQEVVETLVAACQSFVESSNPSQARIELLKELSVPVSDRGVEIADTITLSTHAEAQVTSSLQQLARVCDSLATVSEETDVEMLRRVLDQTTVDVTVGRRSSSVRVCTPTEAVSNSYTHVFVPGLTTEHTPSPLRRPAFARALNESHTEFEAADPVLRTRYLFGLLLTSDATLRISAPERNANSDKYVQADVLVELQRVADVEIKSRREQDATPATRDDVFRSMATAVATGGVEPTTISKNAEAYDIDITDANTETRLADGIQVAAARSKAKIGKYDAQVGSTVVDELRTENKQFSPSQLETYADCGFKYYMKHVLKMRADETITLELNALDVGIYIHNVFEQFYTQWVSHGNEAVTKETLEEAQHLLYKIASELLEDLDTTETAFHTTWLRSLFDGLAVDENQYGNPEGPHGLFRRFLSEEIELTSRDAHPAYFEAHVGLPLRNGGGTVISPDPVEVPGTDVEIRGKIDRLDMTPDGEVLGFDYKTGSKNSIPSEADTIDGHAFQLPAYLLMAEAALNKEAISGSYYQVNPSSPVSSQRGTIENGEKIEFRKFLDEVVPDRIEQIATAVQAGSFHPTVLDPSEAGCKYCEYRDACDVRHHRRHETQKQLNDNDISAYIPGSKEANQ